MATKIYAYIGRDNEERIQLLQNNALVVAGAVTKAVLRFGSYCFDTISDPDVLYFLDDDKQVLCIKLGLVLDRPGTFVDSKLTIWDPSTINGYAWSLLDIIVGKWPICELA